ncbi:hypothetical protein ACLI09_10885 [Flavobacterium sp. RHBU_24]|uniref:hypothetical protein n=1 Tax=Flavobacterium sp. RHBU_24 TaxID=3391185 RepID=UPI0039851A2A
MKAINLKNLKEHEWFIALVCTLLAVVTGYLLLHFFGDCHFKSNYEFTKLSEDQKEQISNMLIIDSLCPQECDADLLTVNSAQTDLKVIKSGKNCITCPAVQHKIILYLSNEFDNGLDPEQVKSISTFISLATPGQTEKFLKTVRLRVHSNFWLIGPMVYWEIVFWSWFGVLSNLIFSFTLIAKNSTTDPNNPFSVFDSSEIPSQVAKLLYAPMCTLIIVFGYNYFAGQVVDIESSKGVIVFAFIGGFYSSRLISLLERLKEVILPGNANATVAQGTAPAGSVDVEDITIKLDLDSSITGELRNSILEIGLGGAKVTLEPLHGGETITAPTTGEDQESIFVVKKLSRGIYQITAEWAQEVDGEHINLEGSLKTGITVSQSTINITVSKSESEG